MDVLRQINIINLLRFTDRNGEIEIMSVRIRDLFSFFLCSMPGLALAWDFPAQMSAMPVWDIFRDAGRVTEELKGKGFYPLDDEHAFSVPQAAVTDSTSFTAYVKVRYTRLEKGHDLQLFSQRTAETGWSWNTLFDPAVGSPMIFDGNGIAKNCGWFCWDGKPCTRTYVIAARRGFVTVYEDGRELKNLVMKIVPNLEPIWIGKKTSRARLGAELLDLKFYGPDKEFWLPGVVPEYAACTIGGVGWQIDVPQKVPGRRLPKLLLRGDSILSGYGPLIQKRLAGKVDVCRWGGFDVSPGPVGSFWSEAVASDVYDIVVFNNGLHSLHWTEDRVSEDDIRASYASMVRTIRACAPKAKAYYLLTTPHGGEQDVVVVRLNEIARQVMSEMKVPVIDAYSLLKGKDDLRAGDPFHWKPAGYGLLADLVAGTVFPEGGIAVPAFTPVRTTFVRTVPDVARPSLVGADGLEYVEDFNGQKFAMNKEVRNAPQHLEKGYSFSVEMMPIGDGDLAAGYKYSESHGGLALAVGSGWSCGFRLEASFLDGGKSFTANYLFGQPEGHCVVLRSTRLLLPNRWNHVVGVWDGSFMRLYVNGEAAGEISCARKYVPPVFKQLALGNSGWGCKAVAMRLGRVAVWSRPLSEREAVAMASDEMRATGREAARMTDSGPFVGQALPANPVRGWKDVRTPPKDLPAEAREFFVSPTGDDAAAGTRQHPLKTLSRARECIRSWRKSGKTGSVRVTLLDGTYPAETLRLSAEDSGEPGSPVVWRAEHRGRAIVSGGRRVGRLRREGSRLVADLSSFPTNVFAPMAARGFNMRNPPFLVTQLYRNGRALPLAADPENGYWDIAEAVREPSDGLWRIKSKADLSAYTGIPDVMAFGYWQHLWADAFLPVRDLTSGSFLIDPERYGFYPPKSGRQFRIVNALVAADKPGEWYVSRRDRKLFVVPPVDSRETDEWMLPTFDGLMLEAENVHDIVLDGLRFEYGRHHGIRVRKARRFDILRSEFVRLGGTGAILTEMSDSLVWGCRFAQTGHVGLELSGGDRRTLKPSGLRVENCEFAESGVAQRTYSPGVKINGCAITVRHNHFHDMPSSAMGIGGNDHRIDWNLVERCVLESDDQGATDTFGNPSWAGFELCFNVWRNIGTPGATADSGRLGQGAIRFDDAISGMKVFGNRFENCSTGSFGAVQINGGRANVIDNNVMTGCRLAASIYEWPKTRWAEYFRRAQTTWWFHREVDARAEPYHSRYPHMARLASGEVKNAVLRNILVGGEWVVPFPPKDTDIRFNLHVKDAKSAASDMARLGIEPLPPADLAGTY